MSKITKHCKKEGKLCAEVYGPPLPTPPVPFLSLKLT